jgi:hypothetical protein
MKGLPEHAVSSRTFEGEVSHIPEHLKLLANFRSDVLIAGMKVL